MNGSLVFVLLLVSVAMLAQVMKTWIKHRHVKPESNEELEATLSKIDLLEDRIKALERVITEN